MIIKVVWRQHPAHVRARIFSGPDVEHLALNGELAFHYAEWERFEMLLSIGAWNGQEHFDPADLIIEEEACTPESPS